MAGKNIGIEDRNGKNRTEDVGEDNRGEKKGREGEAGGGGTKRMGYERLGEVGEATRRGRGGCH
ncbi:hypothetical protein C1H46_005939 [Malus baccata]|uniref:Uncharacterized protein n=1 Tax=Malus baccata TaxID=106549 RepID=A0A540NBR1_MALBA|nr:hypothetical protein C1H46_005939 [Malus baccata]